VYQPLAIYINHYFCYSKHGAYEFKVDSFGFENHDGLITPKELTCNSWIIAEGSPPWIEIHGYQKPNRLKPVAVNPQICLKTLYKNNIQLV
jgi:hypothetical protein